MTRETKAEVFFLLFFCFFFCSNGGFAFRKTQKTDRTAEEFLFCRRFCDLSPAGPSKDLISSWVCNCGSFRSVSAIADLINKVLWQRTVYFQRLDLRAESSGVGCRLPHIHSRKRTHTHAICVCSDERSRCQMIRPVFFCDLMRPPWLQIGISPFYTSTPASGWSEYFY